MKYFTMINDIKPQPTYKRKKRTYSEVIYTLDIETTSAFLINGKWCPFDYSKPTEFYQDKEKCAVMYIGMFGIESNVYYFRTWDEFADLLKRITHPSITKIIYVHNLAFEFQFLRNVFSKYGYTVENMLARKKRKPITFELKELNIIFRCSYCLTNLSLEKCAEKYNKKYFKLAGDLDYNVIRGYSTELTPEELGYCENDITTLFETISVFRKEYRHTERIPLTQTGEVRRAFSKFTPFAYKDWVKDLIPQPDVFLLLMGAFAGGLTHSNYIRTSKTYNNVVSYDITSSYPTAMLYKYPMTQFKEIRPQDFDLYSKGSYAFLICVRFEGVRCKYNNAYIPRFKCRSCTGDVLDNGRVISCDMCEMIITDIDYNIIMSSYDIKKVTIISCHVSLYRYLPKKFVEFVLKLYADKTTLKGVKGKEAFYMKQKQMLNSMFGCCCTNVIRSDIGYSNNDWEPHKALTLEYVGEKLDEQRESNNNLFAYQWGVWCTAHARRALYMTLTGRTQTGEIIDTYMDYDAVYYDTDSIKMLHADMHKEIFELYDKYVVDQLTAITAYYKLPYDLIEPEDIKGVKHHLGFFDLDGVYTEFRTEGSKRYAYRTEDGILKCTVAGVSTSTGKNALHDNIENFRKGLVFDYDTAGKLTSIYNDEQEPVIIEDEQGHKDFYDDSYATVLMPTTYTLNIDNLYERLIEWAGEFDNINDLINKMREAKTNDL